MVIDLFNLDSSPRSFKFSLAPSEIDLESENARLKGETKVRGKLTRRIAQTDVEGEISALVETECTRCLQPVEKKLEISFLVSFVAPENYTEEREAELKDEDLNISILEGDKIDLTELVREQIVLYLPDPIFCREDCKGFCQKCGANRNLINCNCEEKEIDPRWQSLRELKFKNEK